MNILRNSCKSTADVISVEDHIEQPYKQKSEIQVA